MKMKLLAVAVSLFSASAFAASPDCNCDKVTKSVFAADQARQDKATAALVERNAQQDQDIHNTYVLANSKYTESAGKFLEGRVDGLEESKVDKSVFQSDQQRQDDALAAEASTRAQKDSGLQAQINSTSVTVDRHTGQIVHLQGQANSANRNIAANATAIKETGTRIDNVVTEQAGRDAAQDEHINAVQGAAQTANEKADANAVRADGIESSLAVTDGRSINNAVRLDGVEKVNGQQDKALADHETRITANTSDISQLYSNGSHYNSRIDAANANIQANHESIQRSNKVLAEHSRELASHDKRLGELERGTNSRFSNIDRRMNENKKDADAGVASVAAMANIPQVTEYQTFAIGAGVGTRHDQQALAVGFSARASQAVVIKASVATDTNDSFTAGAGLSVGW